VTGGSRLKGRPGKMLLGHVMEKKKGEDLETKSWRYERMASVGNMNLTAEHLKKNRFVEQSVNDIYHNVGMSLDTLFPESVHFNLSTRPSPQPGRYRHLISMQAPAMHSVSLTPLIAINWSHAAAGREGVSTQRYTLRRPADVDHRRFNNNWQRVTLTVDRQME